MLTQDIVALAVSRAAVLGTCRERPRGQVKVAAVLARETCSAGNVSCKYRLEHQVQLTQEISLATLIDAARVRQGKARVVAVGSRTIIARTCH
jgi:hypothetical protein